MEYLQSVAGYLYSQGILTESQASEFCQRVEEGDSPQSVEAESDQEYEVEGAYKTVPFFPSERNNTGFFGPNGIIYEVNESEEATRKNKQTFVTKQSEIFENACTQAEDNQSISFEPTQHYPSPNPPPHLFASHPFHPGSKSSLETPFVVQKIDETPRATTNSESSLCIEAKITQALASILTQQNQAEIGHMAQRIFSKWQQDEEEAYMGKMKRMIRNVEGFRKQQMVKAFHTWARKARSQRSPLRESNSQTPIPRLEQTWDARYRMSQRMQEAVSKEMDLFSDRSRKTNKEQVSTVCSEDFRTNATHGDKENMFSAEKAGHEVQHPSNPCLNPTTSKPSTFITTSQKYSRRLSEGSYHPQPEYLNFNFAAKQGSNKSNKSERSRSRGRSSKSQRQLCDKLSKPKQVKTKFVPVTSEEMAAQQCTFTPNISASQSVQPGGLNPELLKKVIGPGYQKYVHGKQFLESSTYSSNKSHYLATRWEKDEHECTFQPNVGKTRKKTEDGEPPAHDRLYQDFNCRRANKRKMELTNHLEEPLVNKFTPDRPAKNMDKKFGLDKEPFYERFNRLYSDHEKKIRNRRIAKEKHSSQERMKQNFKANKISRSISRSISQDRSSLTRLSPSPAETRLKHQNLLSKVNKEEGVTFKPKLNTKMNKKLVDPSSNILSRNEQFLTQKQNKLIAMKKLRWSNQDLYTSIEDEQKYPSLNQYQDLVALQTMPVFEQASTRYNRMKETYSKVTEPVTIEEEPENEMLDASPVEQSPLRESNLNRHVLKVLSDRKQKLFSPQSKPDSPSMTIRQRYK